MPKLKPVAPPSPADTVTDARKALVTQICDMVRDARTFWQPVFKQMRKDMQFACGDQWPEITQKALEDKYKVNFVQRQLNQDTATIYAKNPSVSCEKQQRLEYTAWDGDPKTLEAAQQAAAQAQQAQQANAEVYQAAMEHLTAAKQAGQPPDEKSLMVMQKLSAPPQAMAIINDYEQGLQRKALMDRISETAQLLIQKILDGQSPEFENQMKNQLIREKTCGAAYVSIKFRRVMESTPSSTSTASNFVTQFEALKAKQAEVAQDPQYDPNGPVAEELKLMLNSLQQSIQSGDQQIQEETIVLDFKPATSVIIDPACRCLIEFVGADFIAEEFLMSPDKIQGQWSVNVKGSPAKQYMDGTEGMAAVALVTKAGGRQSKSVNHPSTTWNEKAKACVWIVQQRSTGMKYVCCDGYPDFLEEPAAPWPEVSGFWTIGALKMRRVEVEENKPVEGTTIFGQSDVSLLRPMQEEMNRSQEGLRQHRKANRPRHICGKDTFDKNDRLALASAEQHDVVPLNNVPPGADCSKIISPVPTIPIQPELYETGTVMQQAMLVTGTQQANLGQQAADEKATGQAIAAQSHAQASASDVDTLDQHLSWIVGTMFEMAIQEMQEATVKQIVGPGAVWPVGPQARQMAMNHLYLCIEAASTGRPNQAQAISNFNALAQTLIKAIEMMGLDPTPVIKYQAKLLDFDKHFDVDEWLATAKPPAPPEQPAAETISIKLSDLTPDERAQALAMAGIQPTPGATTPSPAVAKAAENPAPGKPAPATTPKTTPPAKPPAGSNLPTQQLKRATGATG